MPFDSLDSTPTASLENLVADLRGGGPSTLDVPGQTHLQLSPNGIIKNDVNAKLVIVMVGLPARGKLYITKKLLHYLNWQQYDCRIFNVGNTRRQANDSHSLAEHDASFFDPNNLHNAALREEWAVATLDAAMDWLVHGSGLVAVFDATNTTKQRRALIMDHIHKRGHRFQTLFLESICTNKALIDKNIRLKLLGPDYRNKDPAALLADFKGRLAQYEKAYETIDEEEEEAYPDLLYVKIVNAGRKVIAYNVEGFLALQTVFYLLNFSLAEKQIWITRTGETTADRNHTLGGDAPLTAAGRRYAKALAKFIATKKREFRLDQLNKSYIALLLLAQTARDPGVAVFTLMAALATETAAHFVGDDVCRSTKQLRMLNEMLYGEFETANAARFKTRHPGEFRQYQRNKLVYRFPGVGGELYLDVINRVRPLIAEMEKSADHVCIVSHKVVTRVLLAYFLNLDREVMADINLPLHAVYCMVPMPYGTALEMYQYDDALDQFLRVPDQPLIRRSSQSLLVPAAVGAHHFALGDDFDFPRHDGVFLESAVHDDSSEADSSDSSSSNTSTASAAPSAPEPLDDELWVFERPDPTPPLLAEVLSTNTSDNEGATTPRTRLREQSLRTPFGLSADIAGIHSAPLRPPSRTAPPLYMLRTNSVSSITPVTPDMVPVGVPKS